MASNRIQCKFTNTNPGRPAIHDDRDEIPNAVSVVVSYCEGGHNFFHGGMNTQGIRISFKDVCCGEYFERFTMGSGVAFTPVSVTRYNAKKVQAVADAIKPEMDALCAMWRNNERKELSERLTELTKGI